MAADIINFEARRDKRNGHLVVYNLPKNDGGGRYEVAGINERYDGPAKPAPRTLRFPMAAPPNMPIRVLSTTLTNFS